MQPRLALTPARPVVFPIPDAKVAGQWCALLLDAWDEAQEALWVIEDRLAHADIWFAEHDQWHPKWWRAVQVAADLRVEARMLRQHIRWLSVMTEYWGKAA